MVLLVQTAAAVPILWRLEVVRLHEFEHELRRPVFARVVAAQRRLELRTRLTPISLEVRREPRLVVRQEERLNTILQVLKLGVARKVHSLLTALIVELQVWATKLLSAATREQGTLNRN